MTKTSSQKVDQGFVLAAGLGTRMRPITDTVPKPLVKVAGKSMLDYALDALQAVRIERVVVNVHYLADQIEDHLKTRGKPAVLISDERAELLNSGGGVKHGLHLLSDDGFVILNADSFWIDGQTNNLTELISKWDPDEMDILMLLARTNESVGFDGRGDFFLREDSRLERRGDADKAPYAYCGALIAKPSLFQNVPETAFNMNILFDDAIAQGKLYGHVLDGLWLHVGTPSAIADAEAAIAERAL